MKTVIRSALRAGIVAVALAALFACASQPEPTPEPEPTPAQPQAQPQPTQPQPKLGSAAAQVAPPAQERQRAERLRQVVQDLELAQYAQDRANAAETAYQNGTRLYGNDNAGAKDALNNAISGFKTVIDTGFPKLSQPIKDRIQKVREDAQAIKAQVAAKQTFDSAQTTYQQAESDVKNERWKEALGAYQDAEKLYGQAYDTAAQKRQAAQKQLDQTNSEIQTFENTATEVDNAEQGGVQ